MARNQTEKLQLNGLLPEIQEFLDKLLNDGGMEKADPILREMMISDLSNRLDKFLFMTVAKELNEQELDTYTRLAGLDQAQALAYLKDVRPQMPQVFLKALNEFREMFLQEPRS